jgi:hypothetical protein
MNTFMMILILGVGMFGSWIGISVNDSMGEKVIGAVFGFAIASAVAAGVFGNFMDAPTGGYDNPHASGADRCDVDKYCR